MERLLSPRSRVLYRTVLSLVFALPAAFAHGAEPDARSLIPADTALLVEVQRPCDLFNSPAGKELWNWLGSSLVVQRGVSSGPPAEVLRRGVELIERSLGTNWHDGLNALTSGGLTLALSPKVEGKQHACVVLTCDNEQTLRKFVDAAQQEILALIRKSAGAQARIPSTRHRTYDCYHIGEAHYAVAGRQLLLTNAPAGVEPMLDRLDKQRQDCFPQVPTGLLFQDAEGRAPIARLTFSLKQLRTQPDVQANLALPTSNFLPAIIAGGYFDLVSRADYVAAGLMRDGQAIDLKIRLAAGTEGMAPAATGFFAAEQGQGALPLLQPEGTLYSATWFRDLSRIWDTRSGLLNPEQVKNLETENQKQIDKGEVGFVELLRMVGPHIRLAVARQRESVYKVKILERLPAAALVVDLRDEAAFREKVWNKVDLLARSPVASGVGLVQFNTYKNAPVTSLRFRDNPQVAETGDKKRYNAYPAISIARGHFVVGSTEEIVRDVIDELERIAAAPAAPVTENERFSLPQVAAYLQEYQERFLRGLVLNQGLSSDEAQKELKRYYDLFTGLDRLTLRTTLGSQQFEAALRIGASAAQP